MATFMWDDHITGTFKLKGLEMILFSMVYSFSKNGSGECYYSLDTFKEKTFFSKATIIKAFNKLIASGLIIKRAERNDNGSTKNFYKVNVNKLKEKGIEPTAEHKKIKAEKPEVFTPQFKNMESGNSTFLNHPILETETNSKSTYNELTYNSTTAPPDKKFGKHKNVILSEKEYNELSNLYENLFAKKLENLSRTLARYDKAYTINKISHYAIIKSWCEMEKPKAERTFNSNTYRQPYKSNVHEGVRTTDTPYRQTTMQEDYERIMADFARLGGAC
ncbi:MAG: helix-turn-helix domain-containing protein [Ruminococcus flavefaciens]|nr:helix-turn-helix domain-containing protein [Ruminococcus flavefaciens]